VTRNPVYPLLFSVPSVPLVESEPIEDCGEMAFKAQQFPHAITGDTSPPATRFASICALAPSRPCVEIGSSTPQGASFRIRALLLKYRIFRSTLRRS